MLGGLALVFIGLLMLFAPGLISVRLHWNGREITRQSLKFLVCDYLLHSFAIAAVEYGFLFLTHPHDGVRYLSESCGFVFKYSVIGIAAGIALPCALKHRAAILGWGLKRLVQIKASVKGGLFAGRKVKQLAEAPLR
jgi:hypothetical protein